MLTTRKKAIELGVLKYFTGKPCRYGHVANRYTASGICCRCGVERTRVTRERLRHAQAPHPNDVTVRLTNLQDAQFVREIARALNEYQNTQDPAIEYIFKTFGDMIRANEQATALWAKITSDNEE